MRSEMDSNNVEKVSNVIICKRMSEGMNYLNTIWFYRYIVSSLCLSPGCKESQCRISLKSVQRVILESVTYKQTEFLSNFEYQFGVWEYRSLDSHLCKHVRKPE